MSSMASLGRMVSGLTASQRGLQVTAHNITNANTPGYIRQQLIQHESPYLNIGSSNRVKQMGLGVTMTEIRQIRDEFADRRFRTENSILSYYEVKKQAVDEVEVIFGEPNGEALSTTINDFWSQTQKLATNPAGIEERMAFIQSSMVFIDQANLISGQLTDYQHNLNSQLIDTVAEVNGLIKGIQNLNEDIAMREIGGDRANDLRDQRNNYLDQLSQIIDINYREEPGGKVVVSAEGVTVLESNFRAEMDLAQTEEKSPFLKPIWKDTQMDVYRMNKASSASNGLDNGRLRSLLMMRGNSPSNSETKWDDIAINPNYSVDEEANAYLIPKIQKQFDTFVRKLTETINEVFNPGGPDGPESDKPLGQGIGKDTRGTPLFVAVKPSIPGDILSGMGVGNIMINPLLLGEGGYNYLPTSISGDESDTKVVEDILKQWNDDREWFEGDSKSAPSSKTTDFRSFYTEFIADIGSEGSEAISRVEEKVFLLTDIDNGRMSMGGVSSDEELTNMMKYQYSYNAAARMVTMLDEMMDTVINRMGV